MLALLLTEVLWLGGLLEDILLAAETDMPAWLVAVLF